MSMVTLLDGGMGQELLRRSSRVITSMWSADIMLNEPVLVRDLHCEFIDSGARVITLNTYAATPQRLKRENELSQLENLHQLAMNAAKKAVELSQRNDVAIAGCLPPLVASYRPDVSLSFEDSLTTYRQLVALQSPASDLFICETMSSITEARAACTAALESGKPVWVALSVSDEYPEQLRSGESLEDALQALASFDTQATLLNCSQPEAITACWGLLKMTHRKIGAYANGFISVDSLYPGGTVEKMGIRHDMNPQQYAEHAMSWARNGASIIGGCCEIGPAHIKALHNQLCHEGFI
jgi:S-methylmethionine-dependent homocysteine/selenocysteine methylase